MLHHTETTKFELRYDFDQILKVNPKILSMAWGNLAETFRTPPRGARYHH